MKYTEEEILAYARSRVRFIDQQKGKRSVLGFMGFCIMVVFVCLILLVKQKYEKVGTDLLLDESFLEGIAMGVLVILSLGFIILAFMRMFAAFYSKEIEAFRLLVKLKEEKGG